MTIQFLKKKVITTIISFFLFVACLKTQAQTFTLSGKVTDEKSNPITGASVIIKGTTTGTTTDNTGTFNFKDLKAGKITLISAQAMMYQNISS